MRNGKLNRLHPRKIGIVQQMLQAGPGLNWLTQHIGQGVHHGVNGANMRQAKRGTALFQRDANIRIYNGEKDQAGVLSNLPHDPLDMARRAHHRPIMADRFHIIKLRQSGLGHCFQRFARGV